MASHKGWDRHFVTIEGSTMKDGRSLNLAKGQFGVVNLSSSPTSRGNVVLSGATIPAVPVNSKLELRLGVAPVNVTRSQSNKSMSSKPFKFSDIVGLRVDAPKQKGIQVDEFRLGYNGLEASSALDFQNGDNEVVEINMSGKALGLLGAYNSNYTVKLYLEAPNQGAFTNQEIVENAVDRFNNMKVFGVPINTYVEASPINSESVALTGVNYTFFKLVLKDNGDATSLALVQAQYPNYEVKLESNENGESTYVILQPTATVLAPFSQTAVSKLPGCDCPTGYTLTDGLCVSNSAAITKAWVAGDTCKASSDVYTITLADDECGVNKLTLLQAAYPELTIQVKQGGASNKVFQDLTISGTNGDIQVSIAGALYDTTFDTDIETTLSNFVSQNATDILNNNDVTVTKIPGAVRFTYVEESELPQNLVLAGQTTGDMRNSITNTQRLIGTVSGGCMTTYSTTVITNVLCSDCSPVLNGLFVSEAPDSYEQVYWKKAEKVYSSTALMGISFKSKPQVFAGDETYRDSLPFIASPVRIRVTGGEPTVSESFTVGRKNRMAVKVISIAQEPESFGGDLYDWEDRGNVYFKGRSRFEDNNFGNWALGQESHLKPTAQYVDYVLTVRINSYAQSFSGELNETFNYHILAEVGRHKDIEGILNALATKAGVETVVAYQ
jgi:hypothetical protein